MGCERLVLYSRDGCHLCDAFEYELLQYIENHDIQWPWEKILVDCSPQLVEKYGQDVPVLTCDDRIICQHFFDPASFKSLAD